MIQYGGGEGGLKGRQGRARTGQCLIKTPWTRLPKAFTLIKPKQKHLFVAEINPLKVRESAPEKLSAYEGSNDHIRD